MFITDLLSITELSRLTNKSRPTIYKYINDYSSGNLDEIPYSFIELFKKSHSASRDEIIEYCYTTYGQRATACGDDTKEVISIILKNKDSLDIAKLKNFLLEELKND